MSDIHFFDRNQEFSIARKQLPHWSQAGAICFITWRTADSLPAVVLERIATERMQLLVSHGLDAASDWKSELAKLLPAERRRVQWSLFETWERQLDAGAGACPLSNSELSRIVAESLLHFDNQRYLLTDYVVMPNHVHLLAAFSTEDALLTQCTLWKRFSSRRINAATGRRGEFWQVEQFDHLVRSPEQFEHLRKYIADNPGRAGLKPGTYRWYSKDLGYRDR